LGKKGRGDRDVIICTAALLEKGEKGRSQSKKGKKKNTGFFLFPPS